MSLKHQSAFVAVSILALLSTTGSIAAAASSGSVSAPAHATIGQKVTVWVSGKTATDIASGAGVALELQPTANRGGNGIAASPKFSAYVVGRHVEITFRWPQFVRSCFGASQCVNTPWHIGSRADVDVCAQSPDGAFDGCAMTTVVVRSPAQRSALARARAPALASMLLTVAQMPTGWSVDSSTGSGVGCLGHTLEPSGIKQTASAAVTFEDNGSLPQVEEKLATYATPASDAFAKVVATLDRCRTVVGSSGGHKVTGTVGQMSFPRYGDQSAAFLVSLTVEGVTADEDVLVVRKGTILVGMTEGAIGSPTLSQFQGFLSKALKRVQ